jgi:hypothetical protein
MASFLLQSALIEASSKVVRYEKGRQLSNLPISFCHFPLGMAPVGEGILRLGGGVHPP